jgi:hypothetical protein
MSDDAPRHPNGRTEAAIQMAERWCDAQPVDQHGIAIDPAVGIMRLLISRLMEGVESNDLPPYIVRDGVISPREPGVLPSFHGTVVDEVTGRPWTFTVSGT